MLFLIKDVSKLSNQRLRVFAQDLEEHGGGWREMDAAAVSGPEGPIMRESAYRNTDKHASRKLFTNAHAWHESEAHALLYEPFDSLDGRQLERDI